MDESLRDLADEVDLRAELGRLSDRVAAIRRVVASLAYRADCEDARRSGMPSPEPPDLDDDPRRR